MGSLYQSGKYIYQKNYFIFLIFIFIHNFCSSECAKYNGVNYKTLHCGLIREGEFQGRGRKLLVLTPDEEDLVLKHVVYKASIGQMR